MEAADQAAPAAGDAANPFASLFQAPASTPAPATSAAPAAGHAPNTAPLPNPWASAGAGAAPGAASAQPAGAPLSPDLRSSCIPAPGCAAFDTVICSKPGLSLDGGPMLRPTCFGHECCATRIKTSIISAHTCALCTGLGMLGAGPSGPWPWCPRRR